MEFRWTCDRTLFDRIPHEVFGAALGVAYITNKLRKGRLLWLGHIFWSHVAALMRKIKILKVKSAKRRGRPRRTSDEQLR